MVTTLLTHERPRNTKPYRPTGTRRPTLLTTGTTRFLSVSENPETRNPSRLGGSPFSGPSRNWSLCDAHPPLPKKNRKDSLYENLETEDTTRRTTRDSLRYNSRDNDGSLEHDRFPSRVRSNRKTRSSIRCRHHGLRHPCLSLARALDDRGGPGQRSELQGDQSSG